MKPIYKSIILLASAAIFFGCAVEEAEKVEQMSQIYTMTGNTGLLTRVEYEDITNNMFCKWEIGDVVNVKASSSNVVYPFTVTAVDINGVAKMSYEGVIPDAGNFTGTATYAPKDAEKARVQVENGSTAHLKYGEMMVANIDGQKIDGANLNFSHPSTAVYRITFKAPVDFPDGSSLTMGGAWSNPAVLELGFGVAQNDIVNAYIIYGGGQLDENGKLKFSLSVNGGDVYSYEFTSSRSITYETGKYWLANIANKTMTVIASTQEGLEAVDLGLPSGTKWANMNLGANRPEEYGDYFAWGETDVYDNTNQTSRWYGVDYNKLIMRGVINSNGNLTSAYDAAVVNWGGEWRMPTKNEIEELSNNCTWMCTTTEAIIDRDGYQVSGNGYTVTGPNGNSVFFPAAGRRSDADLNNPGLSGRYWSSTANNNGRNAYSLSFLYSINYGLGDYYCCYGFTVRPVCK